MGRFVSMRFNGLEHVKESLERLDEEVQKRIVRTSIRKAAKPIEEKARAYAPADTGELRESIRVSRLRRRKRKGVVGVSVVPGMEWFKGDSYYAAFIEFGYQRTKRYLTKDGWRSRRRGTPTVPVEAKPFLRPAMESSKSEVESIFRRDVAKRIALFVAKQARKQLKASGQTIEKLNTRKIRRIARRASG